MAAVYSRQFISCVGLYSAEPVEQTLNRFQHPIEKCAFALEYARHVQAQRLHQHDENHSEEQETEAIRSRSFQNFSGYRRATTR